MDEKEMERGEVDEADTLRRKVTGFQEAYEKASGDYEDLVRAHFGLHKTIGELRHSLNRTHFELFESKSKAVDLEEANAELSERNRQLKIEVRELKQE